MSQRPTVINGGGNVPIIGEKRFAMLCPVGHFEELPMPFMQMFPDPNTPGRAIGVTGCRLCCMQWFAEAFPVRVLSPTQLEAYKAGLPIPEEGPHGQGG